MKRLSLAILMVLFAGPALAAPQCIAPPNCAANQKLSWTGTAFTCSELAPSAPTNANTEVTRWDGTKFVNSNLANGFASIFNNLFGSGCPANSVLTWNGAQYTCLAATATTNPTSACAANESVSWNGTQYVCTPSQVPSGDLCGLALERQLVANTTRAGQATSFQNLAPCGGTNILAQIPGSATNQTGAGLAYRTSKSCPTGYAVKSINIGNKRIYQVSQGDGQTFDYDHEESFLYMCARN